MSANMLAGLSERRRSRSFDESPYINNVEEWRERLQTWPKVTMQNLAKQMSTESTEDEGKIEYTFRM